MTLQQESRSRITHADFQRRGATEAQRTGLSDMWGKPHTDRGIYIPYGMEASARELTSEGAPDARSKDERWCEHCKRVGRIMYYGQYPHYATGNKRFRCCGRPA